VIAKTFEEVLNEKIVQPLKMENTGMVSQE
jgi:CubicO group peptidase (beta-lactamase class C family)